MTSVLLTCGAVVSTRLRRRHEAQKEREREYADNFEALRAENEERVKRLGLLAEQADGFPQQHAGAPPQLSSTPPPAYLDAMDVRQPRRRESGEATLNRGSGRNGGRQGCGEHVTTATARTSQSQRQLMSTEAIQQGMMAQMQSLRPKGSMVDRRDWAAASSTTTTATVI